MKSTQLFLGILLFISLIACKSDKKSTSENTITITETSTQVTPKTEDKAEKIIQETIQSHGGKLYDSAYYEFVFRGKTYRFKNEENHFLYEVESTKDGKTIVDVLDNGTFSRFVNDIPVELSEKEKASAIGAINSVIYFATLPHKLNDAAVNKKYVEETTIKGQKYDVIQITFKKEGGGKDFDDEYQYWIHQNTKKVDYLAYNYQVNGGGVRFRSAYNSRIVNGITFQDYINYKAEVGTPLKALPALYEAGKLEEISRIETQNVINLK